MNLAAATSRPADAVFIGLALAHGLLLLSAPSAALIALGLWWNANTIAHNFIHRPFFRSPLSNRLFSAYLSLLLGFPQTLWRARHLAHHAGRPWRLRRSAALAVESGLVLVLWGALGLVAPRFFAFVYAPGWLAGLGLCWVQGYFEHRGATTSHYGPIYNVLFFNDGYHVEHHERPSAHWTQLPQRKAPGAKTSRWPAILRWLEMPSLEALERLVLRSPALQRFVLATHERAFRKLLPSLPTIEHVGIVGGGIFPRTALILRNLLPEARLTLIDASAANLAQAREFLGEEAQFRHGFFDATPVADGPWEFDLLVIPLSFVGDRSAVYRRPPARAVIVHDWLWRCRGRGKIISLALLKRANLVTR